MSKFIDRARIEIKAGKGGAGLVSFRRERFIPRGGPDGGDGGDGASVIFMADHNLSTLLDFRYKRHYEAENGHPGGPRQKTGKSGEDMILMVPVGTMIYDEETGELIADLDRDGKAATAAQGGKGGWGNVHFKSSVNRAPRRANPGTQGEERIIVLELKLMADVGIIGFPNAGKSTLISKISAARPKIADYPFTTITPNLGVVEWAPLKTFVIADVPGLIEGAAEGKGLGHRFLRHVERTRLLLHLIDPLPAEEGREPALDYRTINSELSRFSKELSKKPQIVAINKADVIDEAALKGVKEAIEKEHDGEVFVISAVRGDGLEELTRRLGKKVEEMKAAEDALMEGD